MSFEEFPMKIPAKENRKQRQRRFAQEAIDAGYKPDPEYDGEKPDLRNGNFKKRKRKSK